MIRLLGIAVGVAAVVLLIVWVGLYVSLGIQKARENCGIATTPKLGIVCRFQF